MRAPLFTFETWKQIFDSVKEDGGNLIILWMGGAFRSNKFPITWRYNREHQNVQHDFAGRLIDYGHKLGLEVLLALTPFGYDGTNQYTLEHPHLRALTRDYNFTPKFGLDCWGFSLNPYLEESQEFMLNYTREMLDFYPQADGLLLESSDYSVSFSKDSKESYYSQEFRYVRKISDELWARNPHARIVVYPHYFTGNSVPGLNIASAKEEFDPRWSVFFTPHSTMLDPSIIQKAASSFYWDPSPTFGRPSLIQAAAERAKLAGVTGFIPSFEPWNFTYTGPDMGQPFLIGQRAKPFGFGWLADGANPTDELLMRLNRLAYQTFSTDPDQTFPGFLQIVSKELFDGGATDDVLESLIALDAAFFLDRTWDSTSAVARPDYIRGRLDLGMLGSDKLNEYRLCKSKVQTIARKYKDSKHPAIKEMGNVADWIASNWQGAPDHGVLEAFLGKGESDAE